MLYDYLGNPIAVDGSSAGEVKIPPPFNSAISSEVVYTAAVAGDVQSCCAHGRYVYYADITNKTVNRYDVIDGTLLTVSQSAIGHANGMAYCDVDNCIYIATETTRNILKLNADTLSLLDTIPLWHEDPLYPDGNWNYTAIAWNGNTKEFYLKSADIFHVYSYDIQYLKRMPLENFPTGNTTQSIETDGSFIYLAWLEGSAYYQDAKQHLYIYTLDGKFLKDCKPYASEFESLAYDGYGGYYMSFCRGAAGYGVIRKIVEINTVDAPAQNGTYALMATVSSGAVTYTWETTNI